jgi:ferric-dicitrate binding protein FerR (iron transport regulator)
VTGRWPRARRWAWWTARTVVIAAVGVVAVWVVQRVPWAGSFTILGVAILVAPLYVFAFWTAHNRGWLIDRADEATDVADRALDGFHRLREEHRAHKHPVARPERLQERLERAPVTTELPRVTPTPPRPAQPPTAPRPAVHLAGGARLGGATASGRGRHAAPDDREAAQ